VAAKIRIGFIGAGFMGQVAHIRSYALLHEECELVALAEPRPRTAELVAARYGIDRVYRDHLELLDSEHLDGIVAAQRFTHHASLLPGLYPYVRHLFTEKPLALGSAQGDRLAELARENGCVHMLGYHRRSDPGTREAKRIVDAWKTSGDLGALRYLRICYSDGDWTANARAAFIDTGEEPPPLLAEEPPPEFAADATSWALWNAADKLVHPLNLLRHFLGESYRLAFVDVSGRLLVFKSVSGITATIEVTPYRRTVGFDEELLAAFDRGYVRLRPAANLSVNRSGAVEIYRDAGDGTPPELVHPQLPWVDPMRAQAADFLRVCRGEASPPTDAAEAAEDLHLVADIVRARVELPGGLEALRAERDEHARSWAERLRAAEGPSSYASAGSGSSTALRETSDSPVAGSKK
jgi:predicted dehydrogenase